MTESSQTAKKKKRPLIESPRFTYFYLVSLLVYTLVCGYVLIFSGSVMIEGMVKGWWRFDSTPQDNYALWWSGLTTFPCLLGVIGGVSVISTGTRKFHNVKILLFVPAVVWSTELVMLNFRWGLTYWMQWLYLVPVMVMAFFILYCVAKEVAIPILPAKSRKLRRKDAEPPAEVVINSLDS
ncbi:hypothetical protein ACFL55_01515 [Candidatus Latescibacterota bacterium]